MFYDYYLNHKILGNRLLCLFIKSYEMGINNKFNKKLLEDEMNKKQYSLKKL